MFRSENLINVARLEAETHMTRKYRAEKGGKIDRTHAHTDTLKHTHTYGMSKLSIRERYSAVERRETFHCSV